MLCRVGSDSSAHRKGCRVYIQNTEADQRSSKAGEMSIGGNSFDVSKSVLQTVSGSGSALALTGETSSIEILARLLCGLSGFSGESKYECLPWNWPLEPG